MVQRLEEGLPRLAAGVPLTETDVRAITAPLQKLLSAPLEPQTVQEKLEHLAATRYAPGLVEAILDHGAKVQDVLDRFCGAIEAGRVIEDPTNPGYVLFVSRRNARPEIVAFADQVVLRVLRGIQSPPRRRKPPGYDPGYA
jgi:hypothetical protein